MLTSLLWLDRRASIDLSRICCLMQDTGYHLNPASAANDKSAMLWMLWRAGPLDYAAVLLCSLLPVPGFDTRCCMCRLTLDAAALSPEEDNAWFPLMLLGDVPL